MLTVLTCLAREHNPALVGLAGIICFAASYCAVVLLQRGTAARGASQWIWLITAGASGGFGIWATHFVAMLAYEPGIAVGYHHGLTLLSLAIALLATSASFLARAVFPPPAAVLVAGFLFGGGTALMHFTGMVAMEVPGDIHWNRNYAFASILLGTVLSTAGFGLTGEGARTFGRRLPAALLLALAVVSLHFTAMTGVSVLPNVHSLDKSLLLSPSVLAGVIAAVTLSFLAAGLAAALFAMRAEAHSQKMERNFKLLVQGVTDYAIYMLDPDGHVSNWNAGAERAKGYRAEEIVGKYFGMFYGAEDRLGGLPERALETARREGRFEAQGRRYRKNGSSFWAHVIIDAIHDETGELIGFAKITRDITRQKEDSDRIATVTGNLDVALENMSQGICLFDRDEKLILSNRRYSTIFRFPEGRIRPGISYREIVELGHLAHEHEIGEERSYAEEHYQRNIALVRSGGGSFTQKYPWGASVQQTVNPLPDGGWVATFEDITERLRSEERIAFLAQHDALTGLPNRLHFGERLAEEILVAGRVGMRVAVIALDLDKFKEINDQHGHNAGDAVLVALARLMDGACQESEFIARIGGDEFAAIKRFADMNELHDFLSRLERAVSGTKLIDAFEIKTGASIGVALYPADTDHAETLVANADLAMYRAKGSLIEKICFYQAEMDESARSRRALANDLWAAIDRNELHLHFQVQKSVATGETTGYEVLLRWRHRERGNVPPLDFIGLAEECGAILPIGEWVLREACREAASWTSDDKIAVNLSPVQLGHADMAAVVARVLRETGLAPHRLEIEITESSIITDKSKALSTLRQIKALGVSIAIDDFGTGYSSLETLRSFPFDKIKLDKSFMNEVETSPQAKAIIRAILALGQSLHVPVLAEGVETQAQLDILVQERCDEAQGYLFGRPASVSDLPERQAVG